MSLQINLPGNHPMWTLQARYSPKQLGQAASSCGCLSKWWLVAAASAAGLATWALTGPKKKTKKGGAR